MGLGGGRREAHGSGALNAVVRTAALRVAVGVGGVLAGSALWFRWDVVAAVVAWLTWRALLELRTTALKSTREAADQALREGRYEEVESLALSLREDLRFREAGIRLQGIARVLRGDAEGALGVLQETDDPGSGIVTAVVEIVAGRPGAPERLVALAQRHGDTAYLSWLITVMARGGHAGVVDAALPIAARLSHRTQHELERAFWRVGRSRDTLELCRGIFERAGCARAAYRAACAATRLGDAADGMTWLGRAVEAGWADAASMDADDLAPLRAVGGFDALREQVRARDAAAGGPRP